MKCVENQELAILKKGLPWEKKFIILDYGASIIEAVVKYATEKMAWTKHKIPPIEKK